MREASESESTARPGEPSPDPHSTTAAIELAGSLALGGSAATGDDDDAAAGAGSAAEDRPAAPDDPAPAAATAPALAETGPRAPFTLAIDIGGSGIKCLILDATGTPSGKRQRRATPQPATPQAVLTTIRELLPDLPFDRISIGFPGVVVDGTVRTAPNLHRSWRGYPLAQAVSELTGRPTRVVNDAGVQGMGVIARQGVEIVVTLGTGMGFALFIGGTYAPNIELAHHPLRKGLTYEEYVGNAARLAVGNRRWSRRVVRALKQIVKTFNPGVLYVGGGNATKLTRGTELPEGVKLVENVAGLLGGISLWR